MPATQYVKSAVHAGHGGVGAADVEAMMRSIGSAFEPAPPERCPTMRDVTLFRAQREKEEKARVAREAAEAEAERQAKEKVAAHREAQARAKVFLTDLARQARIIYDKYLEERRRARARAKASSPSTSSSSSSSSTSSSSSSSSSSRSTRDPETRLKRSLPMLISKSYSKLNLLKPTALSIRRGMAWGVVCEGSKKPEDQRFLHENDIFMQGRLSPLARGVAVTKLQHLTHFNKLLEASSRSRTERYADPFAEAEVKVHEETLWGIRDTDLRDFAVHRQYHLRRIGWAPINTGTHTPHRPPVHAHAPKAADPKSQMARSMKASAHCEQYQGLVNLTAQNVPYATSQKKQAASTMTRSHSTGRLVPKYVYEEENAAAAAATPAQEDAESTTTTTTTKRRKRKKKKVLVSKKTSWIPDDDELTTRTLQAQVRPQVAGAAATAAAATTGRTLARGHSEPLQTGKGRKRTRDYVHITSTSYQPNFAKAMAAVPAFLLRDAPKSSGFVTTAKKVGSLARIFDFYAALFKPQQQMQSGRYLTMDEMMFANATLSLGEFLHFARDFDVVPHVVSRLEVSQLWIRVCQKHGGTTNGWGKSNRVGKEVFLPEFAELIVRIALLNCNLPKNRAFVLVKRQRGWTDEAFAEKAVHAFVKMLRLGERHHIRTFLDHGRLAKTRSRVLSNDESQNRINSSGYSNVEKRRFDDVEAAKGYSEELVESLGKYQRIADVKAWISFNRYRASGVLCSPFIDLHAAVKVGQQYSFLTNLDWRSTRSARLQVSVAPAELSKVLTVKAKFKEATMTPRDNKRSVKLTVCCHSPVEFVGAIEFRAYDVTDNANLAIGRVIIYGCVSDVRTSYDAAVTRDSGQVSTSRQMMYANAYHTPSTRKLMGNLSKESEAAPSAQDMLNRKTAPFGGAKQQQPQQQQPQQQRRSVEAPEDPAAEDDINFGTTVQYGFDPDSLPPRGKSPPREARQQHQKQKQMQMQMQQDKVRRTLRDRAGHAKRMMKYSKGGKGKFRVNGRTRSVRNFATKMPVVRSTGGADFNNMSDLWDKLHKPVTRIKIKKKKQLRWDRTVPYGHGRGAGSHTRTRTRPSTAHAAAGGSRRGFVGQAHAHHRSGGRLARTSRHGAATATATAKGSQRHAHAHTARPRTAPAIARSRSRLAATSGGAGRSGTTTTTNTWFSSSDFTGGTSTTGGGGSRNQEDREGNTRGNQNKAQRRRSRDDWAETSNWGSGGGGGGISRKRRDQLPLDRTTQDEWCSIVSQLPDLGMLKGGRLASDEED